MWKNGETSESETLAMVWQWLHMSKSLVDNGVLPSSTRVSHPGVRYSASILLKILLFNLTCAHYLSQIIHVPTHLKEFLVSFQTCFRNRYESNEYIKIGTKLHRLGRCNHDCDDLQVGKPFQDYIFRKFKHLQIYSSLSMIALYLVEVQPEIKLLNCAVGITTTILQPWKKSKWTELIPEQQLWQFSI